MKWIVLPGFVLAVALIVACSSKKSEPVADVSGGNSAQATDGRAILGSGVGVTVREVQRDPKVAQPPPPGETWLVATVRVDNSGDGPGAVDVTVACDSGLVGSRFAYPGGGAFDPTEGVAKGKSAEGKVLLGLPKGCDGARIEVRLIQAFDEGEEGPWATWTIP